MKNDNWINYCEADATYYHPEGWTEMIDNWISVDDNVPEFIDGKDYSKNVFALYKDYQGKLKFSVFKYVTVFDDNIYFFTWARINEAYSDLREADCEYDDDYEVTHWMPMPSNPPVKVGESEPIHNQLCGCGKPVRYSTHSGMSCNKIARCSTRDELEFKVIELTLQATKAESELIKLKSEN